MRLEPFEKETIINFNEEDKMASIYTRMKRVMTHMKNKGFEPSEVYKEGTKIISMSWEIPVSNIALPRKKKKRTLSKEHKEKLSKNLKNLQKIEKKV